MFLPVAVGVGIGAWLLPRRALYALAEPAYGAALLLLVAVLIAGTGPGSKRWFVLGPIFIQPSEFAKLATVVMLAKYLSLKRTLGLRLADFGLPALIAGAPALLVMAEPDLSTGLIFTALLAVMLYGQGMRPLHVLLLFTPPLAFAAGFSLYTWIPFFAVIAVVTLVRSGLVKSLIAAGISAVFGLLSPVVLSLLKEYQRARIRNFLAPWLDPHGMGWNAIQSQIAIGSGRLLGKGLFHGTQKKLGFLPNQHTDFVFSSIGEETGLAGCLALIALFALLLSRFLAAARATRDGFGSLLCIGLAGIIAHQVFVNVGMLIGLLPVTGIPLPFLSYGGSSLVLNFAAVGLALNVASRPE
jgi:rod shape determining protein RodA